MDIVKRLEEASSFGEAVFIVYHGGSQPGTKRMISPISVSPTDVEARCLATGELRHFRISKLELVTSDFPAPEYNPKRTVEKLGVEDFDKCVDQYKDELEKPGWVVKTGRLSISLHRYFKNGKLRKTPDIGILFMEENAVRPWYTFAPDLSKARSLANLGEAFSLLMEKGRSHAPAQH